VALAKKGSDKRNRSYGNRYGNDDIIYPLDGHKKLKISFDRESNRISLGKFIFSGS